jgi:hypothetical protein
MQQDKAPKTTGGARAAAQSCWEAVAMPAPRRRVQSGSQEAYQLKHGVALFRAVAWNKKGGGRW